MNTSLVTSITCAALIFIGGCASAPSQMPFTDLRKGESEVGASARAYVGDVVYRKFDIKEQFEGFVSGQAKIAGFTVNFADTKVQRMLIDGQDGGITRDQLTGSTFLYPALPVAPIGLIDSDSDGVFEKYGIQVQGKGS